MASAIYRLAFEQPIHALEQRIAELEATEAKSPELHDEIRALRRELADTIAPHLQPARSLGNRPGRPPSRSADVHRLPRPGVRRVRRAPRRQVLRRRPRAPHRLRQARPLQGPGRRPPQRQNPQRTQRVLLRLRPSRRLPQGDGQDEAGRQVRAADHLPDRHARRLSRHRRRRARPGPGHRRKHARNVAPPKRRSSAS